MCRFFVAYWKTLLCAAGIAVLSLVSFSVFAVPAVSLVPYADKWVHALMYAALAVVAFADCRSQGLSRGTWAFLLLLPPIYGGVLELLQEFCAATRSGDWLDLLADTIGGWLALAVCMLSAKRLKK